MDVLLLRLEGPLQAWGDSSQWVVRDTRLEPTKSGVVGLLASCLGWGTGDDERIAALASECRLAVRADRPGAALRDYHTVVGGVMSAEGGVKRNASSGEPETVVSWRDYLADASFLVGLEAEPRRLDEIEAAIRGPVWPPFLGRKSCPPAVPLYPVDPQRPSRFGDAQIEAVIREFGSIAMDGPAEARAVVEWDPATPAPGVVLQRRRDVPLSFVGRRFGYRYVYELSVHFDQKEG